MPASTAGVLVSGGSAANLTALLVAREAAGGPSGAQRRCTCRIRRHSSLARTARAMGLRPHQVRVLPTDDRWRLQPETVAAAAALTAAPGGSRSPCAPAPGRPTPAPSTPSATWPMSAPRKGCGCTSTRPTAASPRSTPKGRALLAGIERADSVTLDPHKWLFQPMECGGVLIRDGARLERTFAIHPDYLDGNDTHGDG